MLRFAQVLAIIYISVTVSDMVTFYLGVALRHGFLKSAEEQAYSGACEQNS